MFMKNTETTLANANEIGLCDWFVCGYVLRVIGSQGRCASAGTVRAYSNICDKGVTLSPEREFTPNVTFYDLTTDTATKTSFILIFFKHNLCKCL